MHTRDLTPLVGKFFHTFDNDGVVIWQGHVTGAINPDLLVVELFDWVMGGRSDEMLVRVDDLITGVNGRSRFSIYDDAETMNETYQNELRHRSDASRRGERDT